MKQKLYIIIFEAETPAGKAFDVLLLLFVAVSVVVISLGSVESISSRYAPQLWAISWFFTLLFSLEYILRLYCSPRPLKYAFSFFGIIDLLAILPGFLSFPLQGFPSFMVIRVLRLLRIFVIFKLGRFMGQANFLLAALRSGFRKIVVFVGSLATIVIIMGALMYLIEGPDNGFTNIPRSMYWAIVTLTTVGYGDIAPRTIAGQTLAALIMLMGYGIIAVPTGILSAEIAISANTLKQKCLECGKGSHEREAKFCVQCGSKL